ncbi:hypothetical protein GIB67_024153 [Kingdonia uniflora]|uniref:Uncharacterized protein n=1 Tax=Kingdonia uniflora TaxID=39325 RepID=A0A7J7LZM5_9MAGN|nr:hypothetical protein GIB67_024153 [Kingdonia uniflora]
MIVRSMRVQTWPENIENFYPIIQRYVSIDKKDQQKQTDTPSSLIKQKKVKLQTELVKLQRLNGEEYLPWDDRLNEYSGGQLQEKVGIGMIEYPKQPRFQDPNYIQSMYHGHGRNIGVNEPLQLQPISSLSPYNNSMAPMDNPLDQLMFFNENPTMAPMAAMINQNYNDFNYGTAASLCYPGMENQLMYDTRNINFANHGQYTTNSLSSNMHPRTPYMSYMMSGSSSQMPQQEFFEPFDLQYNHMT